MPKKLVVSIPTIIINTRPAFTQRDIHGGIWKIWNSESGNETGTRTGTGSGSRLIKIEDVLIVLTDNNYML